MNVNDVQRMVLFCVGDWVKCNKTPIPQRTIVKTITDQRVIPQSTVKAAVRVLVKKGFIRKAITFSSGVCYVQIRSYHTYA